MSQIENEINMLRDRLNGLEEQKRIENEKEKEKRDNPLNVLKNIIDEKRRTINNNSYSRSNALARYYDQEKLEMMEPIFNMLKDIKDRLEILEKK
jgi:histidyl-tRNA synthetase